MKLKLAMLFFVIQLTVKAQVINNLVVFCNEGERFTLILNGIQENQNPETNVRVVGLDLKVYQVKVIFENKKIKDHNSTITFFRTGKECVFALNKKGKKKHTLDYVSEKEIDGFLASQKSNEIDANQNTQTQQAVTLAPTSTLTTNNASYIPTETTATSTFQNKLDSIAAQPTEATKLSMAISMLKNNSFSISQIKQLLGSFSSEQTKVAFSKQVLTQVKNPNTYKEIINIFMSDSVKTELQKYIDLKK
ncbi:MAG: DUF4476 domain-containing protein [Bacteroidia bacterium]